MMAKYFLPVLEVKYEASVWHTVVTVVIKLRNNYTIFVLIHSL